MTTKNYILREKDETEISRLEFQHKVWCDETNLLIKKAGFRSGQTILDLGCGPGYLSFDLSKIVGSKGKIIAADNSEKFIKNIDKKIPGYDNIITRLTDIQNLKLETESLEGVVSRWVLMFIPELEKVIKNVSTSLKPGGVFAAMEYFNFRSMSVWPGKKSFEKIYNAVYKLIKTNGGNADIGAIVPDLLSSNRFEIKEMLPLFRIGRPGSLFWKWLEETGKNHANLVKNNLISEEDLNDYHNDWKELSENPNAFFTAPPVMITIGIKK